MFEVVGDLVKFKKSSETRLKGGRDAKVKLCQDRSCH